MTITLWTIFEILINFYQGGLETWFIYRFLTPRSHERAKIWAVIFAVCEGCLVTAFNYFTVFEGFGSALYWASLLVFAFCFFSDNAVKKFLSISLSQVAILLITSLELNVVSSFFKISLRELVVEQSLLRFVTLIMIQISIFIVFRLILMAFKHTDDYTASDWVTIIAVLIISFSLVMVIHELSLSADDGHRLYINLSYMLVFVLNILIFWIINSLIKKNRKLKEMEIVKLREQYLEQFIGNAESQYDAMRKLRHDIKDKYETVNELLKAQKIDETRKFISESFDLIEKSESYVKTKNNIVNAIVNAKLTMASSLGIKISCITVSDFEGIKGTDLCDLLSNTLENAITACKEIADDANKFLYLKIDRETDTYTFLIKNSIDHSVMDSNPRLTTTKADKKQHGLGTSIIREIARKYNGRCDFYESEGMFCCQVTLMADTYFRCNLLMCSTFIATAFLNDKVCGYINIWVIVAFVVFEEIIAFVFCPVENKNKPIEKDKKPKFKAMGMIVFLLLDLFGGAIINRYQMVGSMILLTNLLIAVLIISAKIKEKRCDKNEII